LKCKGNRFAQDRKSNQKRQDYNSCRKSEKLGIKEGEALAVEATDKQITFMPIPSLEDMCGIFAGHADVAEIKKEPDKLREEY
jgi:hypothetical protein